MPQPRRPALGTLVLPESSPVPGLLQRLALVAGLVLLTAGFLWLRREGLADDAHPERPLGFVDVFYFTVVSLATVGYGDISPVTAEARLTNALLLTPIRIFIWMVFLGTTYQLVLLRYRESFQMEQLRSRLNGHTIVCGFGVKGRAIVSELLALGRAAEDIVVIDSSEEAVQAAAAQGMPALRGDASSEAILRAAAVEKAAHVMAAPNRDDACVLMCLTVRTLAPEVRLVASAREEENVKLLYRAGADVVVAPSVSGGRLMAAAARQEAVTPFLEDLLSFGEGVGVLERTVSPEDAGKRVRELSEIDGALVLGVQRGERRYAFYELPNLFLQPGDRVVYLTRSPNGP
jgi:voltage-gated potassium channel